MTCIYEVDPAAEHPILRPSKRREKKHALSFFPIALQTARQLGVDAMPFVIAIMMAASASFSTPIGYQTTLMVYGPVDSATSNASASR